MVLANIVRAQGKARVASLSMSLGVVLNIILDPIFIFTLHMNAEGTYRMHGKHCYELRDGAWVAVNR